MVEIIQIKENRWKEFKALRLESLKKDPLSFGRAYEEEIDYPENVWKSKVSSYLFAEHEDQLVGLASYNFESMYKAQHIAWINAVYVQKKHRGKKIGSMLIEAVIEKIKESSKIEKIKLIADPTQTPAINLYKKFGFKKAALIEKELKYKGKYYDDLIMHKFL